MNRAAHSRILALVLVAMPAVAHADRGEVAVGPYVAAAVPREGRAGAALRVGLGDWLAFDAGLAFGYGVDGPVGLFTGGLVAVYDVLAWVPELRLAGGGRAGGGGFEPRALATLGLRHHLTPTWSIAAAGGAEWSPDHWLGLFVVGAWVTL